MTRRPRAFRWPDTRRRKAVNGRPAAVAGLRTPSLSEIWPAGQGRNRRHSPHTVIGLEHRP